jgi:hypothetical protein
MPWTKYQAPEGGAPWEKYGQNKPTADAHPQPYTADEASGGGFLHGVQNELDTALAPQNAPPNEGMLHHVMRGAGNVLTSAGAVIPEMIAHPIETAKMAAFPVAGVIDPSAYTPEASGLKKAFQDHPEETAEGTLGSILGGAELGGLGGEVAKELPTRANAGRIFESVMKDAGDKPVQLTRAMEPLERAQQLSARGGGTVSAADNLYKRINTVNPLDYREARDWASNLSRISAQDKMSASPSLRAEVGKLSHAFNQDVGDTAASVGHGEDYAKAMRNYRIASTVGDVADRAKKFAVPAALGAAGAGAGYKLARALMPER